MATSQVNPCIDWSAKNLPEEWKKFKQHVKLMFKGPLKKVSEEEQCSYLLIWVGAKGRDIYNTFTMSEIEEKSLQSHFDKFGRYVAPKTSIIFARYKFHTRSQIEGESIEEFVTHLQLLVKDCAYDKPEEMVRDRIICGIISKTICEKLLTEGDTLTMQQAIEITRSYEITQSHLKLMSASHSAENVDAIYKHRTRSYPYRHGSEHKSGQNECGNCGGHHEHNKKKCPARGTQCHKCKKWNHFSKVCRSSIQEQRPAGHTKGKKKIHTIDYASDSDSDGNLYIDVINGEANEFPNQAFADISVDGDHTISFKIDTGAQVNVIPKKEYDEMPVQHPLEEADQRLTNYSGHALKVLGRIQLQCQYKERSATESFYVVEANAPPVIGLPTSLSLQLIKLVLALEAQPKA
ncbi:uncharacterized protein [Haliotis asinina]|uniref:uncharacterized protein n=1 Tax=Haliotis asinina TaxID=109174 RepID=UPI003531B7B7